MKRVLSVFGLAAACAACCAVPLALPMLVGLTASVAGLAAVLDWHAGIALLFVTGLLGWAVVRRNRARNRSLAAASAIDGACGASCPCSDAGGAR